MQSHIPIRPVQFYLFFLCAFFQLTKVQKSVYVDPIRCVDKFERNDMRMWTMSEYQRAIIAGKGEVWTQSYFDEPFEIVEHDTDVLIVSYQKIRSKGNQ